MLPPPGSDRDGHCNDSQQQKNKKKLKNERKKERKNEENTLFRDSRLLSYQVNTFPAT